MKPKRVGPKRLELIEVGAGDKPIGIVGQGLRALRKRRGRTFVASDILAKPEETFRALGVKELANTSILRECSIQTLKRYKPESKDVIFGAYFLNGLLKFGETRETIGQKISSFFTEVKRVLKKNGRLIIVGDLMTADSYERFGKSIGLKMHRIPISDDTARMAGSEWMNHMSNPSKRLAILLKNVQEGQATRELYETEAKKLGLKSIDELARPFYFIFRK